MRMFDFDLFLVGMIVAGVLITVVFGYMIMAPRNDDEEIVHGEQKREQLGKK